MATYNIHEAKTHLSQLLKQVSNGEEIIIANAGKPVARLVPFAKTGASPRKPGNDAGKIIIAPILMIHYQSSMYEIFARYTHFPLVEFRK